MAPLSKTPTDPLCAIMPRLNCVCSVTAQSHGRHRAGRSCPFARRDQQCSAYSAARCDLACSASVKNCGTYPPESTAERAALRYSLSAFLVFLTQRLVYHVPGPASSLQQDIMARTPEEASEKGSIQGSSPAPSLEFEGPVSDAEKQRLYRKLDLHGVSDFQLAYAALLTRLQSCLFSPCYICGLSWT